MKRLPRGDFPGLGMARDRLDVDARVYTVDPAVPRGKALAATHGRFGAVRNIPIIGTVVGGKTVYPKGEA